MRSVTVEEKHSNMRIDKYLREIFPNLSFGAMQKALRKKDIKVNGIRIRQDYTVMPGDCLEIYIVDDILGGKDEKDGNKLKKGFVVVYEDANILIVNKEQGIPVHPDREQSSDTLIDLVQDFMKTKGDYTPGDPSSFPPALCHRLDRNTGGLVILAKNRQSLDIIIDKMETREIKKYYQCLVKGRMKNQNQQLKAYLQKDENKSKVFINDSKSPGSLEIITGYCVLDYRTDIDVSRLEIELVTGRTHQIRAHLAHVGHPVIGDGKYGTNAVNRPLGAKFQALWAYKIKFDFKNAGGHLNYLNGREFHVEPQFRLKL